MRIQLLEGQKTLFQVFQTSNPHNDREEIQEIEESPANLQCESEEQGPSESESGKTRAAPAASTKTKVTSDSVVKLQHLYLI